MYLFKNLYGYFENMKALGEQVPHIAETIRWLQF